jgi:uncharacterized membrane protein YqjE
MTTAEDQIPTLGRLARRTAATCLGALQNRAELFAVEFQEENDRLLKLVLYGVGALFLGMMTVLLVTGLIIFVVPEDYRVWAALGFAVLYLLGAVGAVLAIKGLLKHAPFAESLNQIKKDSELLDAFK